MDIVRGVQVAMLSCASKRIASNLGFHIGYSKTSLHPLRVGCIKAHLPHPPYCPLLTSVADTPRSPPHAQSMYITSAAVIAFFAPMPVWHSVEWIRTPRPPPINYKVISATTQHLLRLGYSFRRSETKTKSFPQCGPQCPDPKREDDPSGF